MGNDIKSIINQALELTSKERAIVAERDRIAAEKVAEQKATEAREADKKHKTVINNEAKKAIAKLFLGRATDSQKTLVQYTKYEHIMKRNI